MLGPCFGFHKTKRIESENLFYEKGNREKIWFAGTVEVCTREGCSYERFIGDTTPIQKELGQTSSENNSGVYC